MTDRTLFQGDSEPARLTGYGTVQANGPERHPECSVRFGIFWTQCRWSWNAGPGSAHPENTLTSAAAVPPLGSDAGTDNTGFNVWLRRLYTAPTSGELVAMDSKARLFPARAPTLHPGPGRHLPHPLLRRTHPPPGPHHPLAQQRPNHQHQRPRPLRSLQPHQRNTGLGRQDCYRTRAAACRGNTNTHRPHV
jgi:hypothetical protein